MRADAVFDWQTGSKKTPLPACEVAAGSLDAIQHTFHEPLQRLFRL